VTLSLDRRLDADRLTGIALVVAAAVLWSTAGLVFRFIETATPWQVVFWRSGTLVPFVFLLIAVRSRGRPLAVIRAAGWHAVVAGCALAVAFTAWILALSETTVANAVFVLCCSPIVAAVLAWMVLGERLSRATVAAMAGVLVGLAIMTGGAVADGRLLGNLIALGAAFGFAAYTVTVRLRRAVDMTPAILVAGIVSSAVGLVMSGFEVAVPLSDLVWCTVLGIGQVGLGLVIYTIGSRHLPAVELTLLSLIEVVLSPIWVWLLLAEQPAAATLAGGAVMLAAVVGQAIHGSRRAAA